MARFVVEDGERVLYRERVVDTRDRDAICELVITDRRLILTAIEDKPGSRALLVFGVLGALVMEALGRLLSGPRGPQITHQLRRAAFGNVEVAGTELRIESTGEGYAKQWFEISSKQPEHLVGWIRRWAG